MTLSDLEWLSKIFNDTKRRADSLQQLSFLLTYETRIPLLGGASGRGSECSNKISGVNLYTVCRSNYGSVVLVIWARTDNERPTDGQRRQQMHIWLKRASNKFNPAGKHTTEAGSCWTRCLPLLQFQANAIYCNSVFTELRSRTRLAQSAAEMCRTHST